MTDFLFEEEEYMEIKRFSEKQKVNKTVVICYGILVVILFAAYILELVKGKLI